MCVYERPAGMALPAMRPLLLTSLSLALRLRGKSSPPPPGQAGGATNALDTDHVPARGLAHHAFNLFPIPADLGRWVVSTMQRQESRSRSRSRSRA